MQGSGQHQAETRLLRTAGHKRINEELRIEVNHDASLDAELPT